MNKLIGWIRHLRFWPRVIIFHGSLMLLGTAFVWSKVGWISLILGSLVLGAAAAGTFHHFRPHSYAWSKLRAVLTRFSSGLLSLVIVYMCLWGRFIEYGALVGDDVTWTERVSGILLAGVGFLLAGVFLGKGRFEPDPSVLGVRQ